MTKNKARNLEVPGSDPGSPTLYFIMALLTKSKYLAGLACPRYLWALVNDKEKVPEPDVAALFYMDQGNKTGRLATKLFPDGIHIPFDSFKDNLFKSMAFLRKKVPLFEAGFISGSLYARVDILVPVGDEWDIVEVKSGTSVKELNLYDLAFQKHCYEAKGLKIRKCFLMYLNNQYFKKGDIDLEKLFIKSDETAKVNKLKEDTKNNIDYFLEVIKNKKYPEETFGPQCEKPSDCALNECWDFLPENNVFDLVSGGKKSLQLFEEGIHEIRDIPEKFELNDKQGIQRKCEIKGEINIHKEGIKHFLNTLKYPIYCLDFETFSTAAPMFDGLKSWSQVPFQFSLYIVEKEGDEPKHHEFLYSGKDDPREEFLLALKKVLGNSGSVVVYFQQFENRILRELGQRFPEHNDWVKDVIARVVDLLVPFKNFSYYNPSQKGSASLKKVLPAVTGKDYSGMEISGGMFASVEFYNMNYDDGKDVREALLKYCGLDTLGMVWIIEKLNSMCK